MQVAQPAGGFFPRRPRRPARRTSPKAADALPGAVLSAAGGLHELCQLLAGGFQLYGRRAGVQPGGVLGQVFKKRLTAGVRRLRDGTELYRPLSNFAISTTLKNTLKAT